MKIVFVCTDNIGRSVIAEYCLKDYLAKNNNSGIEVSSAGTDADSDLTGFSFAHFDELKKIGIDASGHQRRQITEEIVDDSDLIIAMAQVHEKELKEMFGIDVPLYNEIIKNEKSSIICSSPGHKDLDANMRRLVHYFADSMEQFMKNIKG